MLLAMFSLCSDVCLSSARFRLLLCMRMHRPSSSQQYRLWQMRPVWLRGFLTRKSWCTLDGWASEGKPAGDSALVLSAIIVLTIRYLDHATRTYKVVQILHAADVFEAEEAAAAHAEGASKGAAASYGPAQTSRQRGNCRGSGGPRLGYALAPSPKNE